MATHCLVGFMQENTCTSIYVHFDGYLDGVGYSLQQFNELDKVAKLISHGDRSSLTGGFYGLDSDGEDFKPQVHKDFESFLNHAEDRFADWYYIFKDGTWYCGNLYAESKIYRELISYAAATMMFDYD